MSKFQLSCESTVDLPYSYVKERGASVLFYTYMVDSEEYTDNMFRDADAMDKFYELLASGKMPKTSQINAFGYEQYFLSLLENEGDILHISLGSGMTNSVANARVAAENLMEKFPDRQIIVIDSLASSVGYGFLFDIVCDMRDDGKSIDEIADWVEKNKLRVHHQFFSTDLTHFRRSGRMSGPTAAIATVLGICPIMYLDKAGKIIAYDKVRGKKNAIKKTVSTMLEHAKGGAAYIGKCFVCHSNCLADAKETVAAVEKTFTNLAGKIKIFDIGTIIASHCGPGTVAVFFLGDERA